MEAGPMSRRNLQVEPFKRWRRTLLCFAVLGALGCTSIKRALIAREIKAGVEAMQPEGDTELTDLGDGLFTFRWMVYRTAFLATSAGVILFEPLNTDVVKELLSRLPDITAAPQIRYVIYTHHHADHIGGAADLPGSPDFVCTANTARDIDAWPHEGVPKPTVVFSGPSHTLRLGGHEIVLHALPRGHTDGNLVVHLPRHRTVFVSDLIFPQSVPPVGMPFTSYHGMLDAIDRVQALQYDRLIPSHGQVGTRQDVEDYRDFLVDARTALIEAMKREGIHQIHGDRTLYREAPFAQVIFRAQDALRPSWGHFTAFEEQGFPALQWILFHGVVMNE